MKTDLICTWLKHCDYPLFRRWLLNNYKRFNKIIIYWSEHNRFPYLDHFIHTDLQKINAHNYANCEKVIFIDSIVIDHGTQDWRNISTNEMLRHSDSEWVCSIEQDFFVQNWDKLFKLINEAKKDYGLIGLRANQMSQPEQAYLTEEYVHPACWFMKRSELERTDKDFSANPQKGADHFGLITRSAKINGVKIKYLDEMGLKTDVSLEADCFHLGGVNQNYLSGIETKTFHRPEEFLAYNHICMNSMIEVHPMFKQMMVGVDEYLKKDNKLNLEWEKFFY